MKVFPLVRRLAYPAQRSHRRRMERQHREAADAGTGLTQGYFAGWD